MKTASLTCSVSRLSGGLFTALVGTHVHLAKLPGMKIEMLGLGDRFTTMDATAWHPLQVEAFPIIGPSAFGYSHALRQAVLSRNFDLLHTHGIWMYPSAVASAWHRKTRRPYLISPHGMLDPWALRNSVWKKVLVRILYEKRHLHKAACIRALCQPEASSIRKVGLQNPMCVIPNGVDLPDDRAQRSEDRRPRSELKADGRKVLLYLGRIHQKKGLVNLLRAWKEIRRQRAGEWVLAIAGWDQGGHEDELKCLATELGLQWQDIRSLIFDVRPLTSLFFLGPQFGEAKAASYRDCDAFILPSFSEGLPMVVLEAWAYAKPVLMTPECNLPEGFAAGAALRIETNSQTLAASLDDLFRTPHSALRALGEKGRELVVTRFTWPRIAAEMKAVYDWVLGGGPKPACVITN